MILKGKKVAYITLGCKLNFSETSTIRHHLEECGTVSVGEKEGANIFIINTCSVTEVAEKKGRQQIRKIIQHNPAAYIVVVGCYVQLRASEIQAIEGVNLVLGAGEKFNVADYLLHEEKHASASHCSGDIFQLDRFDLAYSYGDRTRSFLKIQDGCDYFCSYCTIPFARGKSRSATIEQVLQAVNDAASRNVREIILTGVNTGDFGKTRGEHFIDLLSELDKYNGIDRFRISSIEPNLLTDNIIRLIADSKRFMPHFHIPLQSGSNRVLNLMKRRYTRELFAEKVHRIREIIPHAFIGVDVITGMRGETEADYEDSLRFITGLDISQLHVFPYSERSGTKALEIEHIVSAAEKHRRVDRLIRLSDEKTEAFYRKHQGNIRPTLFEESRVGDSICGFTDNYIRVEVPYDRALGNCIADVKLGSLNASGHVQGTILSSTTPLTEQK